MKSLDPLNIVLQCIQNCVEEFDRITKQIESEANFDLYSYWQRNIPAQLKNLLAPKKKGAPDTKRDLNTARSKTGKTSSDKMRLEKIKCSSVTAKEHHKVGKGAPVSKREVRFFYFF